MVWVVGGCVGGAWKKKVWWGAHFSQPPLLLAPLGLWSGQFHRHTSPQGHGEGGEDTGGGWVVAWWWWAGGVEEAGAPRRGGPQRLPVGVMSMHERMNA